MDNGSTLVIDHREALTSIDINSARSTGNADIETTAFKTNMAAAVEIARQIRLRNIGGQIVIDFIDMSSQEHCRQVEQAFKEALATRDKARIQLGKISKFGLLEMSRQRMKTSLDEVQLMQCEGCHGRGMHRRPRSVALSVLRLLEQESMNKKDSIFEIKVHPKISDMLSNAYRQDLCAIEKRCAVRIIINPQAEKSVGDYEIVLKQLSGSHHVEVQIIRNFMPDNNTEQEQLVRVTAAPKLLNNQIKLSPPNPKGDSIFKKIWNFFLGAPKTKVVAPVLKPAPRHQSSHRSHHKDRSVVQKFEEKSQSSTPHQTKAQPQQNRRRPMKKPSGGPLVQEQEATMPIQAPVQNQSTTQQGQRSGRRRYRRPSENDASKNKTDE
jgi:ribonuclease E